MRKFPDIVGHLKAMKTGFKRLVLGQRLTAMYPEVILELPEEYRGMIKLDLDKCVQCGLCARICPANAIKMYRRENKRNPGINYQRCIFCGFCVDICPVGALELTSVHDSAFYTLDEQIFIPEKLSKKPFTPYKRKPRKVKSIIDERRGIVYE